MNKNKQRMIIVGVGATVLALFIVLKRQPQVSQPKTKNKFIVKEIKEDRKDNLMEVQTQNEVSSPKVQTLREIFTTKNDNDPRLDTEFRNLSSSEKEELRNEYENIKRERLNDRGTLVFILAREIKNEGDLPFFKEVLQEPACMSLINCEQLEDNHDNHLSGVDSITLVYPQIMALKMLQSLFLNTQDPVLKEGIIDILSEGLVSDSHRVREETIKVYQTIEN